MGQENILKKNCSSEAELYLKIGVLWDVTPSTLA